MNRRVMIAAFSIIGMIFLALIGYLLILFLGKYVIDEKKFVMNSAATLVDEKGN